ncbi:MAG: ExbD/TolR family protein [Flavobacteriales bacterium]|jgi:biopolymer transport protein ExbD
MGIRSQNKIKAEAGMASMTDLVFLLLIFFVVLSTMVNTGMTVDLPSTKGETTKDKSNTKVTITADNELFVNDTPVTMETLEKELKLVIDEDKIVELRSDKKAEFDYAAKVISIVKQNRWKIVIITKQG